MIKVRQIKIDVLKDNEDERYNLLLKKLKVNKSDILSYKISKQSIDARDKNSIFFVYEFIVSLKNESNYKNFNNDISLCEEKNFEVTNIGNKELKNRPVIVGCGPAGLMAAYILAEYGYKPLIIERGKKVEERQKDVEEFWKTGILNTNSNVQFGEGGAGTFSDGKLNTLIKDKENFGKKVFETFVKCGAPEEILYSFKPHIGTDILSKVVANMRNDIIFLGGEFRYNSTLTDLIIKDGKLCGIKVNEEIINTDVLILAIGHSARDTFYMLHDNGVIMENKPFAVGIRVEHNQKNIDIAQYGKYAQILEKAPYKLTYTTSRGKGVYSFCMCPGGYVVNASSEENMLAINGMSYSKRDSINANSAIVVSVDEKDYGANLFDGIKYQRNLESLAYKLGEGKIPTQVLIDYKNNRVSKYDINPIIKGDYHICNINEIFDDTINESIKEAFINFGKKIKGFDNDDVIIHAVESRTSSPVKIIRDENFESNIKGLYPIGEGAGYAGGITSAGIDGVRIAKKIIETYKKC